MNAAKRNHPARSAAQAAVPPRHARNGLLFGLGAYALWGVLPILCRRPPAAELPLLLRHQWIDDAG